MKSLANLIAEKAHNARHAARTLAAQYAADPDLYNRLLHAIAQAIEERREQIHQANQKDLAHAEAAGLAPAMLDRLRLKENIFQEMVQGVRQVAQLPNPLGEILSEWTLPNGLHIQKKRVPIGNIGIIYESRPNVTVDASILCLKTGNAVILRGGSEAFHSNQALVEAMRDGLARAHSSTAAEIVQFIPTTDRAAIIAMAQAEGSLDLLIPRGGKGLIRTVMENARVPVIKHYEGICILYVHAAADLEMAKQIILNAKTQKPAVCNAVETVLIDEAIAGQAIPLLFQALAERNVKIVTTPEVEKMWHESPHAKSCSIQFESAMEETWRTEFLSLTLAVRVVSGLQAAIEHIETYGSHHSDGIITEDTQVAEQFLNEVDSATVYWNASTRFTDGGQFGFGAEIGISTDKIHARGPMALPELTSYKYLIRGKGQIRT
ncbi:MAG: glutamate-5-semialdehyde dehydrogenase [Methylacidiphilales bacterium]|nr:glutamate-5-semialdehyde dehydrogenase [Candidatus Methylacidiphilales bacterium]MDW8349462.1 glutamate-5-semialdehyde dehydrogenase [Verrucomicrobiae bacterium]